MKPGGSPQIARLHDLLAALPKPPVVGKDALPVKPVPPGGPSVIADARLDELRTLKPTRFDFKKLIWLCEELNSAYSHGCYFATIMLTRAILDHVPPLFGINTFTELANNYAGAKSFKNAMRQLDTMAREIADLHLHTQIRKEETLPVAQQVNFGQALDLLLSEIARITR